MPDTKSEPTAPVPAADGKSQKITTSVWSPAGLVAKSSIIQSAIQSVRDAIPVVYELVAEIDGEASHKKSVNGEAGTEFVVNITYTARDVAGKADPVDLDKVVRNLEVPRSIHDGDPDFLDH